LPSNPSPGLFEDRLAHLVRRDGLEGVAGTYGVQPRAVVGWLKGRTTPSGSKQRSIVSRGLRISGPSRTVRNPTTGLFESSIVSGHAAKAIATINRERRLNSEAGMAAATNPRRREMERAAGLPLTRDEEKALDTRMRRLNRDSALYGGVGGAQEAALMFDWRRFDRDYTALSEGRSPAEEDISNLEDEEIESITTTTPRTSYLQNAYAVIRNKAKQVFIGPQGGYYYRSPGGYKVYVEAARVYAKERVVPE